jgi:hypothetical protein
MHDALAQLYAAVLRFIQKAVEWYSQKSISRAISSVTKPWALTFKDNVDEITLHSERVDKLAGIENKMELRHAHVRIQQLEIMLQRLESSLNSGFSEMRSTVTCTYTREFSANL